jgi:hypothetical protein
MSISKEDIKEYAQYYRSKSVILRLSAAAEALILESSAAFLPSRELKPAPSPVSAFATHSQAVTIERMKRIENLDVRSVCTQGIVRDGGIIHISIASCQPAAWRLTRRAGFHAVMRSSFSARGAQRTLRGKFLVLLRRAFRKGKLRLYGRLR